MQRYLNLLLLTGLLFTAAACDSNDDKDELDDFGSASVKVTGAAAAETEFSGHAVFTEVIEGGETYFNLVLTDESIDTEDVEKLVAFQRLGERPGTGEYTIDGEDVLSFYIAGTNDEDGVLVGGETGNLKITRSTDSVIEGTFTFIGAELASEEETTVSGTFKAVYVDDDQAGGVF